MEHLINTIKGDLYASSHGVFNDNPGEAGILYALSASTRSTLSVCIGSGQGLVPKTLREAQRRFSTQYARTILIDANKEAFPSNGKPNYFNDSVGIIPGYEEIIVIQNFGNKCANMFDDRTIDILYEDSDHQIETIMEHFELYKEKIKINGYFIIHDTFNSNIRCTSVKVPDILEKVENWNIINFPEIGEGFTIMKRMK